MNRCPRVWPTFWSTVSSRNPRATSVSASPGSGPKSTPRPGSRALPSPSPQAQAPSTNACRCSSSSPDGPTSPTRASAASARSSPGRSSLFDDSLEWVAFQTALQALYGDQRIAADIAGTPESLSRIDAGLLQRCHQRYYHAGSTQLIVCGPVDAAAVCRRGLELLGGGAGLFLPPRPRPENRGQAGGPGGPDGRAQGPPAAALSRSGPRPGGCSCCGAS